MTDPVDGARTVAAASVPVPGWVLTLALVVGAVVVLGAATLGWLGIAVIVTVVTLAYLVLLRWSHWPRCSPARFEEQP